MRTVSSKVSKREHAAIVQYANQAGESVSNLIRKVVISDAVYGDSGEIPEDCHVNRYPVDMEEKDGDKVLKEQIKEIKVSLGWKEKKPTITLDEVTKIIKEESKKNREPH